MKQQEFDRISKRELRGIYRSKRLDYESGERADRKEKAEQISRIVEAVPQVLRDDNKKIRKQDKKPGKEFFIDLYRFIPRTAFDSRDSIPSSWKPHSFNKRKQHLEFLKSFVYPYPLPETLLWASHTPDYTNDEKGQKVNNTDFGLIRLVKKWVGDIASGASFYKQNQRFFTKAEAHYFLTSKVPYIDLFSVIKLYFYAKCRARSMNHQLSIMAADVFSLKFSHCFKNPLVEGFLELLARTQDYRFDRGMLGNICDFVLDKIRQKRQGAFSFSGRTIYSLIKLTNEWHECLRREAQAQRQAHIQNQGNRKPIDTSHWKGLGITQFRHETSECIWTITELRTAQDLVNEGRKMKNCVSSYSYSCASGNSAIFSIERFYPVTQLIEKAATLEVSLQSRTLVQAKGKCNSAVSSRIMSVIARWAENNRIKIRLLF